MTKRRIAWIALGCAVLVQAGFLAGYSRMTDGCFCAITQAPDPPPAPPHVRWFVHAAAHPLVLIGTVGGTRAAAYGAAVLNASFWFAAVFVLLNAVVRLYCIPAAGTRPRSSPRIP